MKNKNHVNMCRGKKITTFDKINKLTSVKTFHKVGIEAAYLNIMKATYTNPCLTSRIQF